MRHTDTRRWKRSALVALALMLAPGLNGCAVLQALTPILSSLGGLGGGSAGTKATSTPSAGQAGQAWQQVQSIQSKNEALEARLAKLEGRTQEASESREAKAEASPPSALDAVAAVEDIVGDAIDATATEGLLLEDHLATPDGLTQDLFLADDSEDRDRADPASGAFDDVENMPDPADRWSLIAGSPEDQGSLS